MMDPDAELARLADELRTAEAALLASDRANAALTAERDDLARRLAEAERQLAEIRKRSEVTRAWITETCIANRGRRGAIGECLLRMTKAANEVFDGWGDRFRGDAKLHFVLQIERPTESAEGGD